jgi:hypothetical protein
MRRLTKYRKKESQQNAKYPSRMTRAQKFRKGPSGRAFGRNYHV